MCSTIFRLQNILSIRIKFLSVLFLVIITFSKTVYSQTVWSEDFEGNSTLDWHVDAGSGKSASYKRSR